jgi:hypothetical protein
VKRIAMVCLAGLAATATARADIGLVSVSRTSAHPSELITARFGGYGNEWPRMPVYLVPVTRLPVRYPCTMRNGARAVCEPRVLSPPTHAPYTWLGRIHYAPPTSGRFTFRVPHLAPGAYHFVVYCAPCYRGPGGSLVDTDRAFRVLR